MTSAGAVTVDVLGRDVNLVALLTRLEGQMRKTDQVGIRLSQTMVGPFTAAQQRAANASIAEAQALARAAVAAGDNARAHTILVGALHQSAAASTSSVAGLTTSINRLQSGAGIAQQFGEGVKGSLLGMVGPAAAASAAIAALSAVVREAEASFKLKANLDATTTAIKGQLVGLRDSGTVFREAQAFADKYKLTQQDLTSAIQTSIGVMRVSKASTTEILNTFGRLVTLAPDKTISDAARAVRELAAGDVTSIKELFNVSAENAHKMKTEIQQGGDAIEVVSKFLDKANIGMQGLEAGATGAAGKMKELAQESEKASLAFAGEKGGLGLAIVEARLTELRARTRILSGDFSEMGQSINKFFTTDAVERFQTLGNFLGSLAGETDLFGQTAAQAAGESAALAEQAIRVGGAMDAERTAVADASAALAVLTAIADAQAAAVANNTNTIALNSQAMASRAQLTQASTQATDQSTAATLRDSLQAQIAATNSQTLAVAKTQLTQQAQNAANALFASGDAGAAAAAKLANSTSLVDQMTAALYRLAAAKTAASIDPGAGTPAQGGDSLNRFLTSAGANQRFLAARTAEATAAQQAQILATGTHAQKIVILQGEYERLSKIFGANSAQAIDAQTKLLQAQQAGAKGAKGAAGVRLTDQQKLNNSLLADQERFADQSEAAEREHGRRLLDIEADYQKKSQEQERENDVSKRQSKADFYDSLTSATKDVGPKIAQELSTAYEAAYAQAQTIAQAGNAKLAADYLALKERQIRDEIEFQKRLAEAQKAKDTGEVERLQAIHKLRQDAAAEEEKQLLAGGDTNVKARDEALTEEQRRFEEAQGKIGIAAENAAERKINSSLRNQKEIDAENTKLREQEALYNNIGARAPGAPGVPVSPTPTTPGAIPVSGPLDFGAVVAAITALGQLLSDVKAAIERDTNATTSAIRGLGSARAVG